MVRQLYILSFLFTGLAFLSGCSLNLTLEDLNKIADGSSLNPNPSPDSGIIFDGGNQQIVGVDTNLNTVTLTGSCLEKNNYHIESDILNAQIVCSNNHFNVVADLSSYPDGIYILKIVETATGKIVGTVTLVKDTVVPTPTITTAESSPTNNNPLTYHIVFSEDIIGLTGSDFLITNGLASVVLPSGTSYKEYDLTVIPLGSPVTVSLPANTVMDAVGNKNTASNSVNLLWGGAAAPTALSLVIPANSPGSVSQPTVKVGGVTENASVKLYTDSSCTVGSLVGQGTVAVGQTSIQIQTSALNANQSYQFFATSSNGVDTSACSTATVAYTYDNTVPSVTNITSSAANGAYTTGTITLNVFFSEPVEVIGAPELELNILPTIRKASYSSGSGTNILNFSYTIGLGDNAADLDYTSINALTLNGGTIKDNATNSADLTLVLLGLPGSLGFNKNIEVAATIPPVPTNFIASSLDSQIDLEWSGCAGCTYEIYWDTTSGVTTASNAITGITGLSYSHLGLTNQTIYYYKIRAVRSGVGESALSSEFSSMPYPNICTSGTVKTTCTIGNVIYLPDNGRLTGSGSFVIPAGGSLNSNTGQSISLYIGGSLTTQSGGAITANFTSLSAGSIDVNSGSTVIGNINLVSSNFLTVSGVINGNILDSNLDNLIINSGGKISADGLGFAAATGDGPGGSSSGGSGGGHGGVGGNSRGGAAGGFTYGSLIEPITKGSGGGTANGGAGGGVLKLFVNGILTNNGNISANGLNATVAGGGGAGGSIWINVGFNGGIGNLTGNGNISSTGGNGSVFTSSNGAGGGGGRVAVYSKEFKYRGTISYTGGKSSGFLSTAGDKGTFHHSITNVNSICDIGTLADNSCAVNTPIQLGDGITVNGQSMTITDTGSLNGNFVMNLTGDLTIQAGGKLNADGYGYGTDYGNGPGSESAGGSGGGHGGVGGISRGGAAGGIAYGSDINPVTYGSGGGYTHGGFGGGALKIFVDGTLTNDGVISANALNATSGGGGGAGGSIWINVGYNGGQGILSGTGTISGIGGDGATSGSTNGAGGGGGRIAVYSKEYKYRGTILYVGGKGTGFLSKAGDKGTFHHSITNINSICDTGTLADNSCTVNTFIQLGDGIAVNGQSMTITNTGSLNGNITMNLTGDLTIQAGGKLLADGFGNNTDYGDGKGSENTGGSGGGHGGAGGDSRGGAVGGSAYGSLTNPVTQGSGGGGVHGGRGGGALKIFVDGTLTNNGIISSDGLSSTTNGGGGAGGSIWINAGYNGGLGFLAGTGVMTAKGGNGSNTGGSLFSGGGGGGRIAVYSKEYRFRGTVLTSGGSNSGFLAKNGENGTFYQQITNLNSLCDSGDLTAGCVISTTLYLGNGLTISGTNMTVTNTGKISGNIVLDLDGNLDLQSGGEITAMGLGHSGDFGDGAGAASGSSGSGGGHGGAGGLSRGGAPGGQAYGSDTQPITYGSGGAGRIGGAGGGALKILVKETMTLNGKITVDGMNATLGGGGGAGGSVWLDVGYTKIGGVGILTGTGVLTAKGGNGSSSGSGYDGGGGGGGRIAIYSKNYSYRGAVSVAGGNRSAFDSTSGEIGTFYQQITNMDSLCDGGDLTGNCLVSSTITLGEGVGLSGGNYSMQIQNTGKIQAIADIKNSVFDFGTGTLAIDSGGILDYSFKFLKAQTLNISGSYYGNIWDSQISGNATVFPGGLVSANRKGFAGGAVANGLGPAGGVYGSSIGGGGGYGGSGGKGSDAGSLGGSAFGSNLIPVYLGSGGAGDATGGGSGGGILKLVVDGTLTVDGILSANGVSGGGGGANGGGAGGSVWIKTNSLAGAGIIAADGGSGLTGFFSYGGGGGGGRIAIYYSTNTFAGTTSVNGGAASGGTSVAGTAGTIYTNGILTNSPQIILATSTTYTGNLNGLSGADSICNSLMQSKGLGGTWYALLSDGASDAATRYTLSSALYNLRSDTAGGAQVVALNDAALWSGALSTSIGYNEYGVSSTAQVWSGTNADGSKSADHCSSWTSTASNGEYGAANSNASTWVNSGGIGDACSVSKALYCVSH